jgi:hypothetical protein
MSAVKISMIYMNCPELCNKYNSAGDIKYPYPLLHTNTKKLDLLELGSQDGDIHPTHQTYFTGCAIFWRLFQTKKGKLLMKNF